MKKIFYRIEPFLLLLFAFSSGYYLYQLEEPNIPIEPTAIDMQSRVFFDKNIASLLKKTADDAVKTLDVVSFTCSDSFVLDAVRNAAERGVHVRLICGKDSKIITGKMNYFHRSPEQGIMHEKFMIKDGALVIVSTGNLSNIHHNNTALLFEQSPTLVKILAQEVDDLIAGLFERKCVKGCDFEEGKLYFGPGACRAIATEVKKAKNSLHVALYTATVRNPLFTALKKVSERNVPLVLVVDDWNGGDKIVNKEFCLRIGYRGADARFDNRFVNGRNMLLHDKIAVIDQKTAIIGSMNWTSSGCYKNRELVIKLSDSNVVHAVDSHILTMARRGKSCLQ